MALLEAVIGLVIACVSLEVFWTSVLDSIKTKNPKLTGWSYLWMFPIYAVAPFIFLFVTDYFQTVSIYVRGLIYVVAFYLLEFVSGFLIKKAVGVSPWNYEHYKIKLFGKEFRSNYKGIICLQYAPVWYVYGVVGELYFYFLMGL